MSKSADNNIEFVLFKENSGRGNNTALVNIHICFLRLIITDINDEID